MRRIVFLCAFLVAFSGCTIRFTSSAIQDGGVFKSSDFAETWDQKVFVRQEKNRSVTVSDVNVAGIVFSPRDPQEMMLLTFENGIFRSLDGGDHWQALSLSPGHYPALLFDPVNAALLYTATGPTILKSADEGISWEVIYTETRGEAITALAIDALSTNIIYAATSSGTILKSENYGSDWLVLTVLGDTVRSLQMSPIDPKTIYAVTPNTGIFRTTDAEQQWTPLTGLQQFPGAQQIHQLTISTRSPSTLLAATNYGIVKSSDGGDTWEAIKTLIPFGSVPVRTAAFDAVDLKVIYFTVNSLLHKSEDGGETWRTIETVPTRRLIVRMSVHPNQPGVLYLGMFKVKR